MDGEASRFRLPLKFPKGTFLFTELISEPFAIRVLGDSLVFQRGMFVEEGGEGEVILANDTVEG